MIWLWTITALLEWMYNLLYGDWVLKNSVSVAELCLFKKVTPGRAQIEYSAQKAESKWEEEDFLIQWSCWILLKPEGQKSQAYTGTYG